MEVQGLAGSNGYLHFTLDGLLVKPEAAAEQLGKEEKPASSLRPVSSSGPLSVSGTPDSETKLKSVHFYDSVKLDPVKIGSNAGQIGVEIISHFTQLPKVKVEVSLDITVTCPEGVSEDLIRTIKANCQTLKFQSSEFD